MFLPSRKAVLSKKPFNPLLYSWQGGVILKTWWAAEDYGLMVDDGSGVISSWTDRVAGVAVTATTTARPTWSATSFDTGKPGLTFDGTANALSISSTAAVPTGSTAGELVAVCKANDTAAAQSVVAYGATTAGQNRRMGVNSNEKIFITDGTTSNSDSGSVTGVTPSILVGEEFSTTQNCWINGNASSSNPTTAGSLNTGTTRLRIGASAATSASIFWNGVIADIMVFQGTFTQADRQKLEGYFAWKYQFNFSLASGHPYRFTQPAG